MLLGTFRFGFVVKLVGVVTVLVFTVTMLWPI